VVGKGDRTRKASLLTFFCHGIAEPSSMQPV